MSPACLLFIKGGSFDLWALQLGHSLLCFWFVIHFAECHLCNSVCTRHFTIAVCTVRVCVIKFLIINECHMPRNTASYFNTWEGHLATKTDTALCRRIGSKKSSSPGIQEQTLVVLIPLQIVPERLSPFPTLR